MRQNTVEFPATTQWLRFHEYLVCLVVEIPVDARALHHLLQLRLVGKFDKPGLVMARCQFMYPK